MAQNIFSQLAQQTLSTATAPAGGGAAGDDDPTSAITAVAQEYGVNPNFLLGLAQLETRGGKATVKGQGVDSRNLFNIKDFSKAGTGIRALDKAEGSNHPYRRYDSASDSARDLVRLLGSKRYEGALTAQTPEEFAAALKRGRYATDPDYERKLASTIKSVQAKGGAPAPAPVEQWDQGARYVPMEQLLPGGPPARNPNKNPDFLRGAGDVGLSFLQGAAGSVKSVTDLAGAGNAVSRGLDDVSKGLGQLKSEEAQQSLAYHQQKIKDAETNGDWKQEIAAYGDMVWDMPADSLAQALGSLITLGAGKTAQALKLALSARKAGMTKEAFLKTAQGVEAAKKASNLGAGVNLGLGVGQGVGGVKGEQYERTYNAAKEEGLADDEAQALATEAQSYGKGWMQQAAGAALGYAAAKTGPLEKLASGQTVGAGGVVRRFAGGAAIEGASEGGQGGQSRYAGNTAAIDAGVLDESQRFAGVAGTTFSEGSLGFALGGGAGALGRPDVDPLATTKEAAKKPNSPISRAAVAGQPAKPEQQPAQTPVAAGAGAQAQEADPTFAEMSDSVLLQLQRSLQERQAAGDEDITDDEIELAQAAKAEYERRMAAKPPPPPGLGYNPDPLIVFPDGTAGRKGEMERYVASLPEEKRNEARAKLYGYAPQPTNSPPPAAPAQPAGVFVSEEVQPAPAKAQPAITVDLNPAPRAPSPFDAVPLEQDPAITQQQREDAAKAQERHRKHMATLRLGVYNKNPMIEFLGRHGLQPETQNEFAPGAAERRKATVYGYGPVFRQNGKPLDLLLSNAQDEGFLPPEASESDLYDLVARAINGERVEPLYKAGSADALMQRLAAEREAKEAASYEDFLAQQQALAEDPDYDPFAYYADADNDYDVSDLDGTGYSDAEVSLQAEVSALAQAYSQLGFDADDVLEPLATQYENDPDQYYAQARQRLTQLIAQATQPRGDGNFPQDSGEQAQAPIGREAANATSADDDALIDYAIEDDGEPDYFLQAQTARQLREREDAIAEQARLNAERQQALETKARADDERKRIAQPQENQPTTFKKPSEVPPQPGVYQMRDGTFARFDRGIWWRSQPTAKEALLTEFSGEDQMSPENRYSPELAWAPYAAITGRDAFGEASAMRKIPAKPADEISLDQLRVAGTEWEKMGDAQRKEIAQASGLSDTVKPRASQQVWSNFTPEMQQHLYRSMSKLQSQSPVAAAAQPQDGDILSDNGKPFAFEYGAKLRAKKEGGEVVQVAGGYVVRPTQSAATQADLVAGNKINDEWTAFSEQSGTLGIPRAEMPQVKAQDRGAMVNFLKARGIDSSNEVMPANAIKPTQAEFSPAKVQEAANRQDGNRSIIVSADGYVVDGHHQWMAQRQKGESVKVIKLDQPIGQVLEALKEMPSAQPEQARDGATQAQQVQSEQTEKSKPRIAESGDDLVNELKRLSGGYVTPEGVRPVSIVVPGMPGEFQMRPDGSVQKILMGGSATTAPTPDEVRGVEDAIANDQVQVSVMTGWGGSGTLAETSSKLMEVLHSPSGNSWKAAPANEGKTQAQKMPQNRTEYVAEVRRQLGDLQPGDDIENDIGDKWTVSVVMRNGAGEITGFLPREGNPETGELEVVSLDMAGSILLPTPYLDANGNRKMSAAGKVNRAKPANEGNKPTAPDTAPQTTQEQQDAILTNGLPTDTAFKPGKGKAGTGKWIASAGDVSGNLSDSIADAAKSLAQFINSERKRADKDAERKALAESVATKLKNGEQPTDVELRDLFGLQPGQSYVDQAAVGSFLVEHMGVPRNKIRESLGVAASSYTTDTGTKYHTALPRKLHLAFGAAAVPEVGASAQGLLDKVKVGQPTAITTQTEPQAQQPTQPAISKKPAVQPQSDEEQIAAALEYADKMGLTGKERQDSIVSDLAFAWDMFKDEVAELDTVKAALRKKPSKAAKEARAEQIVKDVLRQASEANKAMEDAINADDVALAQPTIDTSPAAKWRNNWGEAKRTAESLGLPTKDGKRNLKLPEMVPAIEAKLAQQAAAQPEARQDDTMDDPEMAAYESGLTAKTRAQDAAKLAPAQPSTAQDQNAKNYAWIEKETGYAPMRPDGKPYVLKTGVGKNEPIATSFGAKPSINDTARYFATEEDAANWGRENGYAVGGNPYAKNTTQPSTPLARAEAELSDWRARRDLPANAGNVADVDKEINRLEQTVAALKQVEGAGKADAAPTQVGGKFAKYQDEAASYGYTIQPDGTIFKGEKNTRVTIKEKAGRLRAEAASGQVLFTGPATPQGLSNFLTSYWYATRQQPATAAKSAGDKANVSKPVAEIDTSAKPVEAAAKPDPFAGNKIFTADKVAAARARMKSKLGQLNSGIDPELLVDGMTVAGAYIESGVRKFSDYAKAMIEDVGDGVKPYLLSFWEGARNYPGLDTKGMTSVEDSAREHAALLKPEDAKTEAVGTVAEKPKVRKKKTGERGDMVLTQDWGVTHIDGYADGTRGEVGNATKDAFLKETKNYLNAVADALIAFGYEPHADRKGKPEKPVDVNESGVAGSGDVSLTMRNPETGNNAYIKIGDTAFRGVVSATPSGIGIMYRIGTGDRYATRSGNKWAPVDLSANDLATLVHGSALPVQKPAPASKALRQIDNQAPIELQQENTNDVNESQGNNQIYAEGSAPSAIPADGQQRRVGAVPSEPDRAVPRERVGGAASGAEPDGGRTGAGQRPADDLSGNRERGAQSDGRASQLASDYRIRPGELKRTGSWKATAEQNVRIVELVKQITAEGRQATPEEQALLTKFTGWGASEIANGIFPNQYGNYKPEWRELGERLKAALTPEEYAQAKRTTQYAHYTSEPIIRSVYGALDRMGFNGGQVLEPGMGIGLFNGLMPDAMASNTLYTGIEYDSITGNIARLLYPASNIVVGDFTATKLARDFFDAAIGNPPFGQIKIQSDPEYKKQGFLLHDYFFAKTIDRVKPGGLLVFVTSKGTMDKATDRARKYLSERADLVGAIRLPQTAFKDNAGTEVVTDVIFLKKRAEGQEPAGQAWQGLAEVQTAQGPAYVNEYFAAHPEMVLGRHAKTGSMYRADEYTVEPIEGDIEQLFAKAVQNLPKNIYRPQRGSRAERAAVQRRDYDPKIKKEGGIYVADDGTLMQVDNGQGVPLTSRENSTGKVLQLKPREVAWLKGYAGVRDALKQAQYDQLNDGPWEKSLRALNKAYDAFTKEHGPILAHTITERENDDGSVTVTRRYKNEPLIRLDAEGALVHALESINTDGSISKQAVLNGRTLNKPVTPTITNAKDAMFVSLNETGRFDMANIAKLAGKTEAEAISELGTAIYEDPSEGWTTADAYLSGNVVRKLKEAESAARIDNRYERNVEALKNVQPRALAPQDITVQLGSAWVPATDVMSFAAEVMGDTLKVSRSPVTGQWSVDGNSSRVSEWGTGDKKPTDILEGVLNNRQLKVTYRDSEGKTHTDAEATEKVNDIAKKLRREFKRWIWSDTQRADRLAKFYNENYNNIAPRQFDGSHLTLPGVSSRFNLRPHQKRAIWRTIQQGDTYYAHAVGAGKTFTMIAAGMEERRLGLAKKPMYVVPNHMLAQFSKEFLELYPTASIMVADETNFHTHNRRKFVAQAALNDPDAIVITHSAFGRIGMSPEYTAQFIKGQIYDWKDALQESDKNDRVTRKQIERRIEQLENRLKGIIDGKKDQLLSFEELGVDRLYVDEGHEFRKLDFPTNRGNIKGIDPSGSQRSMDLYMKVQYLRQKNPSRALVMASGTPVTNTMGELFTVQRFFQPTQLEEDGDDSFDAWANHYGEVVDGLEQNAAGGYETVSRFAKFVNVPELMSRVRTFMDILTSNQLGDLVQRPDVNGGGRKVVVTPVPDGYKEYQKRLDARIKAIRNRKGPPQPGDDIILSVISDGRFSAIDMRFVDPTLPSDPNSKLNVTIDEMIRAYKDSQANEYATGGKADELKGGSLMLFTDIGLGEQSARSRGFDMKAWIEKRLIEGGVKPEYIAFMRDHKAHAKKERLFNDMRQGRKRILIGGKDMETGVNAQKRLVWLGHLDAPWFPASVEQREGRIIRQGNQNKAVDVKAFATKGSYDSTMWGMNSRKARFIEQAMSGDTSVRSMEDVSEASAFEMAAALASGDERYMKLAGLKADVERLNRLYSAHMDDQKRLRGEKMTAESSIKYNREQIDQINAALAKREPVKAGEFRAQVGGVTFGKREEFSVALYDKFKKLAEAYTDGEQQLGGIGGFPIRYLGMKLRDGNFIAELSLDLPGDNEPLAVFPTEVEFSVAGIATRAANQVNGLERELAKKGSFLSEQAARLEKINRRLGATFPEQSELNEKREALDELEKELEAESKANEAAQAQADGEPAEGATAFSRRTASGNRLPTAQVEAVVRQLQSGWSNAPAVVVVQDLQDPRVPQVVRDENARQVTAGAEGAPDGFIHGETVYLVASQIGSPDDAAGVLLDETLGHYGLRGVFGDTLSPILRDLANKRRRDVVEMAVRYGLVPDGTATDASVADIYQAMTPAQREQAAEEVLAYMAQNQPELGFVQRAIAAIRQWLKSTFPMLGERLALLDSDIVANYITPARAFVEGGRPRVQAHRTAKAQSNLMDVLAALDESGVVDINC